MNQDAQRPPGGAADEVVPEVELADEDILDAMQHVPGYVDISTADFREVYHLAHRHATDRLLAGLKAGRLMRPVAAALPPDMMLDEAARAIVASGHKGLPVVDAQGRVIGMLTETDYLCRLKAGTFLELLLRMVDDSCEVSHRCHETPVREAMTYSPVTINPSATIQEAAERMLEYQVSGLPVVRNGKVVGMITESDIFRLVVESWAEE